MLKSILVTTPHSQVEGSKKVSDSLKKGSKLNAHLNLACQKRNHVLLKNCNSELLARNSTFSGSKKVSDKLKSCQR